MNDPYDDEEDYDDDQYNYDHNYKNDPYQFYFKFDIGPDSPISDMLNKWFNLSQDSLNGLQWYSFPTNFDSWPVVKFPVNSWNPNTANDKKFQYLGSNYSGEPIWKKKYFVHDVLQSQYLNHLQSHAVYFIQQPLHYKSLYDILN